MVAAALAENELFTVIAGPSGQELGKTWSDLAARLATPQCEFGIIAGGRQDGRGYNPLLSGDNDAVVTVASTQLAGAADFRVVPTIHMLLMDDPTVIQYTLRFLQHGYFISPQQRQPLK